MRSKIGAQSSVVLRHHELKDRRVAYPADWKRDRGSRSRSRVGCVEDAFAERSPGHSLTLYAMPLRLQTRGLFLGHHS